MMRKEPPPTPVQSPINYVGEIRGRSDFELLCSACKKPIEKDDTAFLYVNKAGDHYIYGSSCSIALDGIGMTKYKPEA